MYSKFIKMFRLILLAGLLPLVVSCSDDELFVPEEYDPEDKYFDLSRVIPRAAAYPLTDYSALKNDLLSELQKEAEDVTLDKYMGRSYRVESFPLSDGDNLGFPVVDIDRYLQDYDGRGMIIGVSSQSVYYNSYVDFLEVCSAKDYKSKIMSTKIEVGDKVFLSAVEKAYTSVFDEELYAPGRTVYGEGRVEFLVDSYKFFIPQSLYHRLQSYQDESFIKSLYGMAPEELYEIYGGFVLLQFITGATATAVYQGVEKTDCDEETMKAHMIDLVFSSFGSRGPDGGVSIGSDGVGADTVMHDFNRIEYSVKTVGGRSEYEEFVASSDVNDRCVDLFDWQLSLDEYGEFTIADIPDNALLPVSEVIEEDNLRDRINQILKTGENNSTRHLSEPYVGLLMNECEDTTYECISFLRTRYEDSIMLAEYKDVPLGALDEFIEYELARTSETFPGLKQVVKHNSNIKVSEFSVDSIRHSEDYEFVMSESGLDLNSMVKYVDPDNGKIYIMEKGKNEYAAGVVYTIYGKNTIMDYVLEDKLAEMESVEDVDTYVLSKNRRFVAL